ERGGVYSANLPNTGQAPNLPPEAREVHGDPRWARHHPPEAELPHHCPRRASPLLHTHAEERWVRLCLPVAPVLSVAQAPTHCVGTLSADAPFTTALKSGAPWRFFCGRRVGGEQGE